MQSMNMSIITMTEKNVAADMIMTKITTMRSMSTTIIMTEKSAVADMIMTTSMTMKNMSIIMMEKRVVVDMTTITSMTMRSMSIIIMMEKHAAADMITTMIMKDIIMQMMYSQAGEQRHLISMRRQSWMIS